MMLSPAHTQKLCLQLAKIEKEKDNELLLKGPLQTGVLRNIAKGCV